MSPRISIRGACIILLIASAAACSDAVGPSTKAIVPNTDPAKGVGTSPRPQP